MENSIKNQYYQFIRGVAIIFVILIHCTPGLKYPKESFSFNFWMIERTFIGIAVPLFFAMSGYFTKYSKKKIIDLRLIIPFIIWSILYGVFDWIKTGETIFSVKSIIRLITGQNASHLYFVFVLIQIRLMLPFLDKYRKEHWLRYLVISMTVVWYGLYYVFFVFGFFKWMLPFGLTDFFPAWLIYWYIGFTIRDVKMDTNKGVLILLSVIAFVLTIIEGYVISKFCIGLNPTSQIKITNLLYCVCVILLVFKSEKYIKNRNFITYIGDYSYGIYYVHFFLIYIINKYEETIICVPIIVAHLCEFLFVCGTSMTILKICQAVIGKKKSSRFLGI